jgi:biopolymer transport protein ExbD
MNRSTNEGIRRGGWKVVYVMIAVVLVLFVLMMFSDSHQGSAVSLKDQVNQKTFGSTERLLAVRANSMVSVSMNNGPVTGKESTVTMITVASKKQREEELKKKIAEAMAR